MEPRERKARNGKIELLRFVFAALIVAHHSRFVVGDESAVFLGGSLAVEFFFLVSGYLMMASVERRWTAPEALGSETAGFLFNKAKRLYPDLFFSYGIGLAVYSLAKKYTLRQALRLAGKSIGGVFLLWSTGLEQSSINVPLWYMSAMLLVMAVLYPLLRKWPDMVSHVVCPLVGLVLLGWMCQEYSHPRGPTNWLGFVYKGTIRAMAELCLGVVCYQWAKKLRDRKWNALGKGLLTFVEAAVYLAEIAYMFTRPASNDDYLFIFLFMVGVSITFSGQTFAAELLDRPIVFFLGKFSADMYICHFFWAKNITAFLPADAAYSEKLLAYFGVSLVTAGLVYAASDWIRRRRIFDKFAAILSNSMTHRTDARIQ